MSNSSPHGNGDPRTTKEEIEKCCKVLSQCYSKFDRRAEALKRSLGLNESEVIQMRSIIREDRNNERLLNANEQVNEGNNNSIDSEYYIGTTAELKKCFT